MSNNRNCQSEDHKCSKCFFGGSEVYKKEKKKKRRSEYKKKAELISFSQCVSVSNVVPYKETYLN